MPSSLRAFEHAAVHALTPMGPRLSATKPVMPSSLRAFEHAAVHALTPAKAFLPFAWVFFDTTVFLLFTMRLDLVSPPLVYVFVPFHTWRMEPVMDFLVTRLGLRTALRFETRLAFIGLDALRAAFGALGFDARRALRAARREARLAARFGAFGVDALRAARRATVLAAIVWF